MTMIKNSFFVTIIIFAIVIFSDFSIAQNNPTQPQPKPEPKIQQIAGLNAKFIFALIDDGEGGAWIGTEDDGVFHYQADGKISQFTTQNGLGDNNGYALAIDKLGRLWVGHLNSGISVFNGKDWKNYDVVDGPIGERIFDIKICPKDGDVWMTTSAGITRYKIDSDEWKHFTREDGLLEDQASALAFKNDGTLIVGTQCHGLAIFTRNNINGSYRHSKNIVVPDRFGPNNCSPVPLVPIGIGLPSNQINDILVAQNDPDGKSFIWIATSAGLAKANNDFSKIEYWRGRNYADKVRGLYGGAPKDFKQAPKEIMDQLLPEDYLTCLAEDEQGVIWIGTRQNGFMLADSKTGLKSWGTQKGDWLYDNFVTKILIHGGGYYLTGSYGGGIAKPIKPYKLVDRKPKYQRDKPKIFSVAQNNFPNLPSKIKPPTAEELRTIYYKLQKTPRFSTPPKILALNDDWRTQGDWIDRYGRHSAVLCAQAGAGMDFFSGYRLEQLRAVGFMGRNFREKGDQVRRWVHWLDSNDRRVLQCENLGGRKQAEWDDHKEAYPMSLDGPHLYGVFKIPKGKYILSLYFFNKDGHGGNNRFRDYVVTVKTMKLPIVHWKEQQKNNTIVEGIFARADNNIRLRVRDFWGGVYKRFYCQVDKDEYVVVRIDASYSFNTIVSGVFFDPVDTMNLADARDNSIKLRKETEWEETLLNIQPKNWWGVKSLDSLLLMRDKNPASFYHMSRRYLLTLTRLFVEIKNGEPVAPEELKITKQIPRYRYGLPATDEVMVRPDVAEMMRELQFFELWEKIEFGDVKHGKFYWQERSKLGRDNANKFEWNAGKFYEFLNTGKSKQSW
ncbi:MAG: hypothetical protein LBT09_11695 [Planctomycetaceae bacterium]|jgi:hypothetical protein|nr:hypothetical protein [Planctomycetaceae bacterium]